MTSDFTCFNWIQIIKKHSDLSANARFLALYLNTYMNLEHDMAWPSLRTIANETRLCRNTVMKYLAELESEGYLIRGKSLFGGKGGGQTHNTYTINLPEKVVHDMNHLTQKGGACDDKRWFISEPKVVHVVPPNNNRITNNINDQKIPFWNDVKGWLKLGHSFQMVPRAGESWDSFRNRVKNKFSEVSITSDQQGVG